MFRIRTLIAALFLMTVTPGVARADTLLIPFIGVNFGGDAGTDFGDAIDANQVTWGASVAFMGAGVFGIEGDFAYTPDFFGKTDVGGSSVFTATGNILIGVPFGGQQGFGIRPYVVGGLGLLRSTADFGEGVDIDDDNFTWDFGGGVMLFFGTRFGLRGDFRYFRTFDELEVLGITLLEDAPGNVDFTRGSLGFIFRF